MEYKLEKNKIVINKIDEFCPQHILECGQIFSYVKTTNGYKVFSEKHVAEIFEQESGYIIETESDLYELYGTHIEYLCNKKNVGRGIK